MGYFPVDKSLQPYDDSYFDKYEAYSETDLGHRITGARCSLVDSFYGGPLVDVGIGCGQFVKTRPLTWGYDVCRKAVDWLHERKKWNNPYLRPTQAISCWDSLEHIAEPSNLLSNVTEWVFVSLPIFWNIEHILRSKHFRRDEHFWYWTEQGFKNWMKEHGFECRHHSEIETKLGREDIHSFVFKRI